MRRTAQDALGWTAAVAGLIALIWLVPGLVGTVGPVPLRVLFGWGAFVVVPVLMLGGAGLLLAGHRGWRVRWTAVLLAELLLIFLLALTHIGLRDSRNAALAGRGGGLVGWAVGQLFSGLLGPIGARIVALLGAIAAAVAFVAALTPEWIARAGARIAPALGRFTTGGRTFQPLLVARERARAALSRIRGSLGGGRRPDVAAQAFPPRVGRQDPHDREPHPPAREPMDRARSSTKGRSGARRLQPAGARAARRDILPPMELLRRDRGSGKISLLGGTSADARSRANVIRQTLAEFGVPVEVVSIKEGPTVTQFGLEPGEVVRELRNGEVLRRRVSVQSILRLSNDLALALAAPSIRIEAPVPGRPYVGVEVPNAAKNLVSLRNILESREYAQVQSPLAIALGRDVSGDPVVADLTRMPHLLIAGATGSGKSVCINAIVCSLLMGNGPETVRLMMIDPKMVELPNYDGIPHLLGPVITDSTHATGALAWLMLQMDDRYRLFAGMGVRNIAEYNRKVTRSRSKLPLPYLVLVIDELADLMMTAAVDIERQVCRLAQMARATGIHLVLATQRPSVDVITGLIKANFPARIAFAVTTQIDSRVVLDVPGAERLQGRGDMLFMAPDSAKLLRIQGCFISDPEIERIVEFWKVHRDDSATPDVAPWEGMTGHATEKDELLEQALGLLETKISISTSLLQRQLRIGFPRAARLMEQLEEMGAVGPDEGGGRSRVVLWRSEGQGIDR